ncbi:MAG: metallophosphoesterase [Deltaproteobacteria bacterium]|nr:metallophosphoesterase [Deltaproteobacteria bacterium]
MAAMSLLAATDIQEESAAPLRTRRLDPPRVMTGNERRLMNPNRGLIKLFDRYADIFISRFGYPLLDPLWNPYSWQLQRNFALAEAKLSPTDWPQSLAPLRVLLITDIHAGIFLKPETLWRIVHELMQLQPDMVIVGGDLVTGHVSEVVKILDALVPLTRAPLGAWFCFGNHDYFGGNPEELRNNLAAIGIQTLKNDSTIVNHRGGSFVLGGIDDRIMGKPDWDRVLAKHGPPHLLMAHNPDHFYEAEARGIPLTLSGHTHGGQIRLPSGPAIIRQSRFCLDEGLFSFGKSLLVVSRGLGSILLPLRWGADPEAVLIEITPP